MRTICALLLLLALGFAGVIHPQLAEKLTTLQQGEQLEVIVHMKAQADLSTMSDATKAEKILYLQEYAELHQHDLLNYLESLGNQVTVLETWWIFDGIMLHSIDNFAIQLDPIIEEDMDDAGTRTPEWGISMVSAPQCWNDGYDGTGIIVGNIDTGVDHDHPAFHGRWVSGGWFDGINGLPDPYDDHGHGTHTMGTICGGDGNGSDPNDIGVAPGANFIAAKG
jgi:subtilisin family serine protease